MANINFNISPQIGSLLNASQAINAEVMPLLAQAVRAVAVQTAYNWQAEVHKAKLWSGEKDAYADSIKVAMTGDFSAEVTSDYKHASEIETGRPARDLKRMLDTSLKVRRTTSGKRFLIIPMRHNTPGNAALAGDMPMGIYELAKAMSASSVVGQGSRPSGEVTHLSPGSGMTPAKQQSPFLSNPKTKGAAMVNRNVYAWGQRLTSAMMADAGFNSGAHRHLKGMYRFDTTTPGGSKSSQYLTFRVMMEGSTGWVIPSQPGQFLVQRVVSDMQPKAQKAFTLAVKSTIG